MKNEVNELLEAWDSGKPITTLSMGGLGPGYEQAIQIMTVEFARELRHLNIEDYPEKEALNSVVENTCNKVLKRIDEDIGGASGAMYGAAVWLAYQWCFGHGVKGVLEKAKAMKEEERIICVQKSFPNVKNSENGLAPTPDTV